MMKKHLTNAVSLALCMAVWAAGESQEASRSDSAAAMPNITMKASAPLSAQTSGDSRSDSEVDRIKREVRTLRQEADKLRRMARRLEDDSEDLEERAQELLAQMKEFRNSISEFHNISMGSGAVASATAHDSAPVAAYEAYLEKQKLLMTNMRAIADGLQAKALEMAAKVREMKEMADDKESAAGGLEQNTDSRD